MAWLTEQVRGLWNPRGVLARRLPGWERRAEQEAMAEAIAACLEQGRTCVGEAGTGVGKTFAYLLPAILWADATGKQVLVSTRTKALQEQIARKDLPFLQAVLPVEFSWAVAVGRNNYLCLRRLRRALQDGPRLFQDPARTGQIDRIAAWARARPDAGVRNELEFVPHPEVWQEVQAEQGNCLGAECAWFDPCHWQRGKRAMQTARVVVVNHALYFADLALRMAGVAYLPHHDAVVFDEAHHVEAIASEALGFRLSPAQFDWHLSRLANRRASRGLLVKLGLHREARLVRELYRLADAYFEAPRAMLAQAEGAQLRLQAGTAFEDCLSEPLENLVQALRRASGHLVRESRMELDARAGRLSEFAAVARSLAHAPDPNEVRWLEQERNQVVVRSSPIEIGELLRQHLFPHLSRAVLVSGTLGPPEGDFAWLRSRLGIDQARCVRVGSPFPYEDNVEVVLEEGLPDPGDEPAAFEQEACTRIRDHCLANGGRALVLCTSWRFLDHCRAALAPALAAAGLPLLVQGDRPLTQLVEEKRRKPESVLVGTDTLWEGIDIPGEALTLLILTRFPFPVPSHPLIAARCEAIERQGQSGFDGYSVPLALLKFRQGFGRLVRSASDRGRVVVLDPRARRRSYGRRFLVALPKCRTAEPGRPRPGSSPDHPPNEARDPDPRRA